MTVLRITCLGSLLLALAACSSAPREPAPAAPGTDARAIAVAEATLEAMGGRAAWDDTAVIGWEFFGRRRHLWDRHAGLDRIDGRDDDGPYAIVVDLATRGGRAWRNEEAVTDADALVSMLEAGYATWVNDSYWLVMPYKLLDPGVTLHHLGEGETLAGAPADILEVTFDSVGLTPQNKYHVYVGRESRLVEQWDFFADAAGSEPRLRTPWSGWSRHGRIMLSGDRGERDGRPLRLDDIRVLDEVWPGAFDDPAPPGM